ncbi:HEAT repeat domain-containing protein [Ktedonospora formicarum]|uniref:HEAT repeat domain-containing protein n=1 Tax=Ktedonospora formicarum TaxID=2778364 RepID=UPI001C692407|nr:HEAT repeat domain-containing protein [Ktedonospora formicarum]
MIWISSRYETSLSVLAKIERGELSGATTKPLVELLHSQGASANEREYIVDLLGESGERAAVEPLCTALQDSHPDIRMKAAYALGKLGERAATKPLCVALLVLFFFFSHHSDRSAFFCNTAPQEGIPLTIAYFIGYTSKNVFEKRF